MQEPGLTSEETAKLPDQIKEQAQDITETLNQNATVQEASVGLLEQIYQLAEFMAFPAFYWVAFALMVAGVVSFAGQIVISKLVLLLKGKLNIKEILSDVLGLLISLVGLVLTTQAAAENSDFTQNAAMVVSAAVVGALAGLVFYWWGQSQEFAASRQPDKSRQ